MLDYEMGLILGQLLVAITSVSVYPLFLHIDLERAIFNFIWKNKKPRRAKTILYNKRTSRGIAIPDLKLYYRAIVIKTKQNCLVLVQKTDMLINRIELKTQV